MYEYNQDKICQRIKALRKETGLNQEVYAGAVGIAHKTYQRYESGNAVPIDNLLKIAEYHQCSPEYIMGIIDERTHPTTDICKTTGLSADAVKVLVEEKLIADVKAIGYQYARQEIIKSADNNDVDVPDTYDNQSHAILFINFLIENIQSFSGLLDECHTILSDIETFNKNPNAELIKEIFDEIDGRPNYYGFVSDVDKYDDGLYSESPVIFEQEAFYKAIMNNDNGICVNFAPFYVYELLKHGKDDLQNKEYQIEKQIMRIVEQYIYGNASTDTIK